MCGSGFTQMFRPWTAHGSTFTGVSPSWTRAWTLAITSSLYGLKIIPKSVIISYFFNWCPIRILKIYFFLNIHTSWNYVNIILKIFSIYFRVLFRKRLRRANIHVYTQTVFHRNQSPSTNMWKSTAVNTKKTLRRRRNKSEASAISHYFQRLNFLRMKKENTMWNICLFLNHLELVTVHK